MMTPLLFLITFLLIIWLLMRKPKNFPPGPTLWPLVGNIFDINPSKLCIHEAIELVSEKYGEVCGFYIGAMPTVVISGIQCIREVLNKPELQGRPASVVQELEKKRLGIGLLDSTEDFIEQKQFLLSQLKKLGMGTAAIETLIHEGIEDLIQEINISLGSSQNKTFEVQEIVETSGASLIYHMIAGKRFKPRDPTMLHLTKIFRNITMLLSGLETSMPFMLRFFPFLTSYPEIVENRTILYNFLKEEVEEHKKKLDPDNPRDLIDLYLLQIEKPGAHSSFHMEQLQFMLMDLFLAGSDTTSSTLSFAILYMILYPIIQTRVQKELDEVVGRERLPSLSDQTKLRYTEATLNEIYRHSTVGPLALPHAASSSEDVDFRGYTIPKNARVIINLHGLHNDRKYWRDPGNFRPDRFQDDQGNLISEDGLIPFGLGKRSCLGESMARDNVFLTFAALLQNYILRIPDGDPTPSDFPIGGLTIAPRPFKVTVRPRPK